MNLTPRQLEIVKFIRDFTARHDYAPTMQEIAEHLGVSRPTVFEHLTALHARGALKKDRARRSVRLSPELAGVGHELPLLGRIAAGSPIEAVENHEVLDLDSLFTGRPGETFVLQVRGDSMIDEQIRDGDFVIVQKCADARDGQTVVALIDEGDATLKKFYREKGRIRLQPANADYRPILVDNVSIQGVVVGVIRQL